MQAKSLPRAAALLEVLGIYVAGGLVTEQLSRLAGSPGDNPLGTFTRDITNAELITASRQMFVILLMQYAGWFLLILPINWWHRRRGLAAYGLTRAGHSWTALLLASIGTAALAEWPVLSISVADSIHNLGETAAWRQALFDTSWQRWEFWLFSAVASWALIPVAEELFFRGYCQRRLAEDWGDGAAIIGTACLFTFAHSQYLLANAYNAGMITSLFVLAVGLGVVFAWTRSLVPSVFAHAVINVPMTPLWQGVILAAFVIGAILFARRGAVVVGRIFSSAGVARCTALGSLGAGYAIAAARIEHVELAAAGMVLLAVCFEAIEQRTNRVAMSRSASA
jgi:membrane protease YdiL (CAAX protease family)